MSGKGKLSTNFLFSAASEREVGQRLSKRMAGISSRFYPNWAVKFSLAGLKFMPKYQHFIKILTFQAILMCQKSEVVKIKVK